MHITLATLYLILNFSVCAVLILFGYRVIKVSYGNTRKTLQKTVAWIIILSVWQLYIYTVAKTGVLQDFSFPPKLVLLLVLPAFICIGIFVATNRQSKWMNALPVSWLVFYQSFRVFIELLFVASVGAGTLHQKLVLKATISI
jgi:hypothetical protein